MEKARRNAKKLIANIMIMALVLAYIPAPAAQVNAASIMQREAIHLADM